MWFRYIKGENIKRIHRNIVKKITILHTKFNRKAYFFVQNPILKTTLLKLLTNNMRTDIFIARRLLKIYQVVCNSRALKLKEFSNVS